MCACLLGVPDGPSGGRLRYAGSKTYVTNSALIFRILKGGAFEKQLLTTIKNFSSILFTNCTVIDISRHNIKKKIVFFSGRSAWAL